MKLHIANCSPQRHLFNYKLPERRQPFARHIPAGDQIAIDVQDTDITAIIDQHERYGFVDVTKIPKDFSGICYSIDREIKAIVNEAAEFSKESPEPALSELWTDIYA